ncbi:MAG: filamentous hemagglutinin N-terminal domain-containing protein [Verrucomicrobiales bacterium]
MNPLIRSLRRSSRFQAIVVALLLPGIGKRSVSVRANPSGGVVTHGGVHIGEALNGHLMINQLSDKAIINWEDFSIGAGEITQFLQPGAGSAVLNRVVSGNPSAIHGALRANGKVMVINPNGILVGASGSIDVGGLVLSTLDLSDADFLGRWRSRLQGNTNAGVVNYGRINAVGGDVFLMGAQCHQLRDHRCLGRHRGAGGRTGSFDFGLPQCGRRAGLCPHDLRHYRWCRGDKQWHHRGGWLN